LNFVKHAVDIAKHITVPESQHAVSVRLQRSRSLSIANCRQRMLATIDLHNKSRAVAAEVHDELLDADLPSKVGIDHAKAMTQVPPKFSLSVRWR
jgi:hypothetical protein